VALGEGEARTTHDRDGRVFVGRRRTVGVNPPDPLLFRLDLVVGTLCLLVLAVLVLAVAVDPVVGLVGGGVVVAVGLLGVYSYLHGVRAYLAAARNATR
jgi:hypothetical protein